MKLVRVNVFVKCFAFLLLLCASSNCNNNLKQGPQTQPDRRPDPGDLIFNKIKEAIFEEAEERMKSTNFNAKRKSIGILPEGVPEDLKKAGLLLRQDKPKWLSVMAYPSDLFKFCIYPYSKVTYTKWCGNAFLTAENKKTACMYNMCQVCCDNLVFIYQDATSKYIGNQLKLSTQQGLEAIKENIDIATVEKCKLGCEKSYPVDMPKPNYITPRDPLLGLSKKKPGISCADILQWGAENSKSGKYWIDIPTQGKIQVFCDMETSGGGWTLFFNYIHQPGAEVVLNPNKFPPDVKTNSHMYLETGGLTRKDVKELRFYCKERFGGQNKFWHFKTNNSELISVAMTGNQSSLRPRSLQSAYYGLKVTASKSGKVYQNAVDDGQIPKFTFVGQSPTGGFTARAFGSAAYNVYWTMKGENPENDFFECGSNHEVSDFTTVDNHPSEVYTHHAVWFRGEGLSSDDAKKRYLDNAVLSSNPE